MTKKKEEQATNEEVKNPFIDAMYNNNLSKVKEAAEKAVADKIMTRIQEKKEEILNKAQGK